MRARLLKPGFFEDAELCKLDFGARLLFAGLWCLADREGRLLDIPRRIAVEVFPYEPFEILTRTEEWLAQLENGFITRYEADGKKCIVINNFKSHQRCHPEEKKSTLPEPNENRVRTVLDSPPEAKAKAIPSEAIASCAAAVAEPASQPDERPKPSIAELARAKQMPRGNGHNPASKIPIDQDLAILQALERLPIRARCGLPDQRTRNNLLTAAGRDVGWLLEWIPRVHERSGRASSWGWLVQVCRDDRGRHAKPA